MVAGGGIEPSDLGVMNPCLVNLLNSVAVNKGFSQVLCPSMGSLMQSQYRHKFEEHELAAFSQVRTDKLKESQKSQA